MAGTGEAETQCEVVTRMGTRCFNDAEPESIWCIAHLALGASDIESEWTGPAPADAFDVVQQRLRSA
jgi:hypothetical protein